MRLRDLDGDGRCEIDRQQSASRAVFRWDPEGKAGRSCRSAAGRDAHRRRPRPRRRLALRRRRRRRPPRRALLQRRALFAAPVRVDGKRLVARSDDRQARRTADDRPGDSADRAAGTNNGAWVHSQHLWWQNESTDRLPDLVDRRSFNELLAKVEPRAKSPAAQPALASACGPGFTVEQVAAEPLVMDPIAFAWGSDGRLWVVEMADYPLGVDGRASRAGACAGLKTPTATAATIARRCSSSGSRRRPA